MSISYFNGAQAARFTNAYGICKNIM